MDKGCRFTASRSGLGYAFSPREIDIHEGVGQFLKNILPDRFEIRNGQENYIPSPKTHYATLQIISKRMLATNNTTYEDDFVVITQPKDVLMQVNIFGKGAGDACAIIQNLWRDYFSTQFMRNINAPIVPLFADQPRQMAFINGESNYEDEWSIDLHMQVNFTIKMKQDYFDKAEIKVFDIL